MRSVDGAPVVGLILRDAVERIEQFDDELTIYAAPDWTAEARVVVGREPDGGGVPLVAAGMHYFLEVFVAKEVLAGLKELDLEAKTRRLIRYAIADA
jgi:hypothetical protein